MSAGASGRRVGDQFAVLVIPEWPRLFVAPPPAAHTDHVVERFPAGEGVVGGMHDHYAAAVLHVLFEGGFQVLRPADVRRVVVEDDARVLLEVGLEAAEVAARRWSGYHVHLEQPGLFQLLFQHGCRQLPFVIRAAALSIQEHDAVRRGGIQANAAEHRAKADSNCSSFHEYRSCYRLTPRPPLAFTFLSLSAEYTEAIQRRVLPDDCMPCLVSRCDECAALCAAPKVVGGPYVVNATSRGATVAWIVESDQVTWQVAGAADKTSPALENGVQRNHRIAAEHALRL